jgi:hypothetical protein
VFDLRLFRIVSEPLGFDDANLQKETPAQLVVKAPSQKMAP